MFKGIVCITIGLILHSVSLSSQSLDTLISRGNKVRITSPVLKPVRQTGTLISHKEGGILFASEIDTVAISTSNIKYIEVSRGKKRQWFAGLAIGVTTGTLVGFVPRIGKWSFSSRASLVTSFAMGGLYTGATIGMFVKREHWKRIPIQM